MHLLFAICVGLCVTLTNTAAHAKLLNVIKGVDNHPHLPKGYESVFVKVGNYLRLVTNPPNAFIWTSDFSGDPDCQDGYFAFEAESFDPEAAVSYLKYRGEHCRPPSKSLDTLVSAFRGLYDIFPDVSTYKPPSSGSDRQRLSCVYILRTSGYTFGTFRDSRTAQSWLRESSLKGVVDSFQFRIKPDENDIGKMDIECVELLRTYISLQNTMLRAGEMMDDLLPIPDGVEEKEGDAVEKRWGFLTSDYLENIPEENGFRALVDSFVKEDCRETFLHFEDYAPYMLVDILKRIHYERCRPPPRVDEKADELEIADAYEILPDIRLVNQANDRKELTCNFEYYYVDEETDEDGVMEFTVQRSGKRRKTITGMVRDLVVDTFQDRVRTSPPSARAQRHECIAMLANFVEIQNEFTASAHKNEDFKHLLLPPVFTPKPKEGGLGAGYIVAIVMGAILLVGAGFYGIRSLVASKKLKRSSRGRRRRDQKRLDESRIQEEHQSHHDSDEEEAIDDTTPLQTDRR